MIKFFKNINNKIPDWIKTILKILFIIFIILRILDKILGYSVFLTIYNNRYYFNIFSYSLFSLGILYQLLHIFLIYIFSKKKRNIPEILPDFLINWLKEFELMCLTKESTQYFKNFFYRHILVYIIMIVYYTLFYY